MIESQTTTDAVMYGGRIGMEEGAVPPNRCILGTRNTPGRTWFDVVMDPSGAHGTHGVLGSTLLIPYVVSASGAHAPGATLFTVDGWLSFSPWANGAERLASIILRIPTQMSSPPHTHLLVPITPEQMGTVAHSQPDRAVLFGDVWLGGTARLPALHAQEVAGTQRVHGQFEDVAMPPGLKKVRQQDGWQLIGFERDRWLAMLEAFRADLRHPMEQGASPLAYHQGKWVACVHDLESATLQYRHSEYKQTLQQSRKVVEGVAAVLGGAWHSPRAADQSVEHWTSGPSNHLAETWPGEREASAMLLMLLAAAWMRTASTLPDGLAMPGRDDSHDGLTAATDLLMFASQFVAAHPPGASPSGDRHP